MKVIENDCYGCTIPCGHCGADHTPHYYCDECGEEDTLYQYEGYELCKECLLDKFPVVEGSKF